MRPNADEIRSGVAPISIPLSFNFANKFSN